MNRPEKSLRDAVQVRVDDLMQVARDSWPHLAEKLLHPAIKYDLKGRGCAGKAAGNGSYIKLHPWFLSEYTADYIEQTVGHEVAHVVTVLVYGWSAKPHGMEWQSVMSLFGLAPNVTTDRYDVAGMPGGMRMFEYACKCAAPVKLSAVRHNKVVKGKANYRCGKCRTLLTRTP